MLRFHSGGGINDEMRRTSSINSIESGDSSVSSSALSFQEKLKGKTSSRFLPSLEQLSRKSSNLSEDGSGIVNSTNNNIASSRNSALRNHQRQIQLSAGADNSLFHYLYFQEVEGIFVAADDHSADYQLIIDSGGGGGGGGGRPQTKNSLHADIVRNFYTSALTIRNTFEETLKAEEKRRNDVDRQFHHPHQQQSSSKDDDHPGGRFARGAGGKNAAGKPRVYEEGILFHFTPTSSSSSSSKATNSEKPLKNTIAGDGNNVKSSLTYWVVGRMFVDPEPQQLFVCFQDGVEQNLVELAFKLGFGIGI